MAEIKSGTEATCSLDGLPSDLRRLVGSPDALSSPHLPPRAPKSLQTKQQKISPELPIISRFWRMIEPFGKNIGKELSLWQTASHASPAQMASPLEIPESAKFRHNSAAKNINQSKIKNLSDNYLIKCCR